MYFFIHSFQFNPLKIHIHRIDKNIMELPHQLLIQLYKGLFIHYYPIHSKVNGVNFQNYRINYLTKKLKLIIKNHIQLYFYYLILS